MTTLSTERLEEIRALAGKATPGEWTARLHVGIPDAHIRAEIHGCNLCDVIEGTESARGRVTHEDMQANARHIAAANPATVSEIITRLLAAEALLDMAEGALEPFASFITELEGNYSGPLSEGLRPAPAFQLDVFRNARTALTAIHTAKGTADVAI